MNGINIVTKDWYLVDERLSRTLCTSPSLRYSPSLCSGIAAEPSRFISTNMFPLYTATYKYPSPCSTSMIHDYTRLYNRSFMQLRPGVARLKPIRTQMVWEVRNNLV